MPDDMKAEAEAARQTLVEAVVEMDDAVLERFLEGEEPDEATIKRCLRIGTLTGRLVPVLTGSAFKNKGVQLLLDAVCDFMPAPTDVPPVHGVVPGKGNEVERACNDDEPMAALAFKVMTDPFVGSLTFVRVYSGMIQTGRQVLNSAKWPQAAGRSHAAHARQLPRGHQGGPRRRHRRDRRPQGHHDRRDPERASASGGVLERMEFHRSGDRGSRSRPRPRPIRTSSPSRLPALPRRTPPSA